VTLAGTPPGTILDRKKSIPAAYVVLGFIVFGILLYLELRRNRSASLNGGERVPADKERRFSQICLWVGSRCEAINGSFA